MRAKLLNDGGHSAFDGIDFPVEVYVGSVEGSMAYLSADELVRIGGDYEGFNGVDLWGFGIGDHIEIIKDEDEERLIPHGLVIVDIKGNTLDYCISDGVVEVEAIDYSNEWIPIEKAELLAGERCWIKLIEDGGVVDGDVWVFDGIEFMSMDRIFIEIRHVSHVIKLEKPEA